MQDWSEHIAAAARDLGALRITSGPSAQTLDNPAIAAHFARALAMLDRMGRGPAEGTGPLADPGGAPLATWTRGGGPPLIPPPRTPA